MQVLLLLCLLACAGFTAAIPKPIDTPEAVLSPVYLGGGSPAVKSSPYGATSLAKSVATTETAKSGGSTSVSRDEAVYQPPVSVGSTQDGRLETSSGDSPGSSELEEDDDDDVLPPNEDIDAGSIFAALFNVGGEDDEEEDDDYGSSNRTARMSSSKSSQRAVSDSLTITKYNHFIDVFFRRVNSELSAKGEPVHISLSKTGGKNRKKKKGKSKDGNKSKKDKRNPRDFMQKHPDNESSGGEEVGKDDQSHLYAITDAADDDDPAVLEDYDDEMSEGSNRQSKDIQFEDEEEQHSNLTTVRVDRGLGMERRRAESKRMNQNRGNKGKNGKPKKNNKNKREKNKNKKKKNRENKKKKGGKKKGAGKKNKNKKKGNRGRSREEELDASSQLTESSMESRKRKDEKQNARDDTESSEKNKKGKKNKKSKKGKKNKENKAETQASVSGIGSLIRDGDVNVTQSADIQKITSHFLLGPVSVHLERRFSDGEVKTAVSTASLRGTVVIEVSKSGRAKVAKLKLSRPFSVTTNGSLQADDAKKKKGQKSDKAVKTSIKKVSPQISKEIEETARAVLDTTSRAVRT